MFEKLKTILAYVIVIGTIVFLSGIVVIGTTIYLAEQIGVFWAVTLMLGLTVFMLLLVWAIKYLAERDL